MINDTLVYKVVIWVFWGISSWKEKVALSDSMEEHSTHIYQLW